MAHVNKGSHSFTCRPHVEWAIPGSPPCCRASPLSRPNGRRRLSLPGWLGEILRWFDCPKTVTRPSTSRASRELNSRLSCHKTNVLLTSRLWSHLCNPCWVTNWSQWAVSGCWTLPEILEIHWNYFSSWKSTGNLQSLLEISGLVCKFACLSLILVTILTVNQDQLILIIDVSNLGKCRLIHLLIRWYIHTY